jgi:threonylcarbamoyladenosine tRNA methylthiotransferase MtaB
MKYALVTFGCRVNQADSMMIEGKLRSRGAVAASPDAADLVIVNTCSVTAAADQGARQTIRRIVRANPDVKVIVTGCYATRRPDEVAILPNVTRVIRNSDKDALVGLVADDVGLSTADRFSSGDGPCGSPLAPGVAGRTALTLRVQTGCDERCSYCIIPTTRGPAQSRPLNAVVGDIEQAVRAGYKEIAITGVHLGSYGRDLVPPSSLIALLRHLSERTDEVLFRISSLEPMDCTPDIVELVASSPRLAAHFHLPLQHGSDEILGAMRRPYTATQYRALVDRIRARMPHAAIGSDMIVGFPGETVSHFEATRVLLESLPLTHLHVFPYSDRPGTESSTFSARVDGTEIRERGRQLRAIGHRMAHRFRRSQAGTSRRALVVDDGMSAVTDNYLRVPLSEAHRRNEWVEVVIPGL